MTRDKITDQAERASDHMRPMARRLPVGGRASDGEDTERRRPCKRGRALPSALRRYGALLARPCLPNFLPGMAGRVSEWDEASFRKIRAIYYGMISEMDAQLGRLWQALKANGAWENTVIVLTSDHAEMMGDHYMLGKGGFFDGSFHIPLIIRDPRLKQSAGTEVAQFTEAVDIMPTLAGLLGGQAPAHLDGKSLQPFLNGNPPSTWRDAAHWEYDFRSVAEGRTEAHFGLKSQQCNLAAMRTEKYKYVHFGGGLPPLLYQLDDDPGEIRNIAGEASHQAVRLEFAERLLSWRAEHLDQSLALIELTENGVVGEIPRRI